MTRGSRSSVARPGSLPSDAADRSASPERPVPSPAQRALPVGGDEQTTTSVTGSSPGHGCDSVGARRQRASVRQCRRQPPGSTPAPRSCAIYARPLQASAACRQGRPPEAPCTARFPLPLRVKTVWFATTRVMSPNRLLNRVLFFASLATPRAFRGHDHLRDGVRTKTEPFRDLVQRFPPRDVEGERKGSAGPLSTIPPAGRSAATPQWRLRPRGSVAWVAEASLETTKRGVAHPGSDPLPSPPRHVRPGSRIGLQPCSHPQSRPPLDSSVAPFSTRRPI
jgi:hypothetical protein